MSGGAAWLPEVLDGGRAAARFEHTDRGDLLGQVAAHAAGAHGITDITPEILAAVESEIAFAA